MPRLIVFDLDGTLVDSKPDLTKSVNHVRASFRRPALGEDTIASMIGNGARTLVARALSDGDSSEVEDSIIDEGLDLFLAYYREHMLDDTRLYPGVVETLDALADCELAVLTNKPQRFSCDMLRGLGVFDRFRAVYGGNSFTEKKPHPVGLFQLLADTRISQSEARWEAWMVGDSAIDVRTGRNAGVRTCGVTWGYAAHSFADCPPDVRIDRFEDLLGVIGCPTDVR